MTNELDLIDAIHVAKTERMKAGARGDMDTVSKLSTRIGELTAQIWRLRKERQKEE